MLGFGKTPKKLALCKRRGVLIGYFLLLNILNNKLGQINSKIIGDMDVFTIN